LRKGNNRRCLTMSGLGLILLLMSIGYQEAGAVMCNDSCAVVTDVVNQNGKSLHPELPEGLKECSNDTLKECGNDQVCVSTPVEFTALVMENGTTLQNGTVKFVYSACSGSGNTTIDCSNIGERISQQFSGSEFAKKLGAFKAEFAKMQKQMDEMSSRLSQYFDRMKAAIGFGTGWPTLNQDDDWLLFDKRDNDATEDAAKNDTKDAAKDSSKDAAKNDTKDAAKDDAKDAAKATEENRSKFQFYSMILSGCDESTIKAH